MTERMAVIFTGLGAKCMSTDTEAVTSEEDWWWSQAVATRARRDARGGKNNILLCGMRVLSDERQVMRYSY